MPWKCAHVGRYDDFMHYLPGNCYLSAEHEGGLERSSGGKFMSALIDTGGGVTFGIVGLVVIGAGLLILYNEYCDSK